eukprot:12722856-Ditylum_brightwellii.AAC.1
MGTTPDATTEDRICEAEEATLQVYATINRLESCRETLSARRTTITVPDVAPVKIFEEFVELDIALSGCTIVTLFCGGIFKDKAQDKQPIILWS